MFKLHFHTAHVDVLLRWMPPARNKLRLYLQATDTMPRRTDQRMWSVDHWQLKYVLLLTSSRERYKCTQELPLRRLKSWRLLHIPPFSHTAFGFVYLTGHSPGSTKASGVATQYHQISILGSEAKKTIKDSLLTLPWTWELVHEEQAPHVVKNCTSPSCTFVLV